MKRPPVTYREFRAAWAREQAAFDWALLLFCGTAIQAAALLGSWP